MNSNNFPNHSSELKWNDAFLLGYNPMDAVHEEFCAIVSRFHVAEDDVLPALLEELEKHLVHHFKTEDQWMIETNFPPRDCHMDEHAAVLQSVAEVRLVLATGDVETCRDLVEHLIDWFPGHADHLDSALAHWMSKLRLGGKPVVIRRNLSLR
ncbi:MAG: hypothetical protein RL758_1833 [Pseudomonadota bacterium]|jgi:hemerythrin